MQKVCKLLIALNSLDLVPCSKEIVLGVFLMQHVCSEACCVLLLFYSCCGCWQCVITILCMLCKGPGGVQFKTLGADKSCAGDDMKSPCCCLVWQTTNCTWGVRLLPARVVTWDQMLLNVLLSPVSLLLLPKVDMVGRCIL